MTTIRQLFDPTKDIHRSIEKVITYGATQEARLKAEISEYVVTDHIDEQLRKLLDRMQLAMRDGGEHEIGVWVSGFYGSGKSSFTKYLGFAFDQHTVIEGVPFYKHLQNRLRSAQTKAQLATVVQQFPAAVVMLDLASDMLAGNTLEDVSTVLYFKVLQWAGYSRNLKVAALERRIEKDGRQAEFHSRVDAVGLGLAWRELQNDPLVVDALVPQLAHEMYPQLFPTANAFSSTTADFVQFESGRVEEMLDIVRTRSGKENILFIVDEVGQYVGGRDNLILNLDGLAKNLKRIGDGKVWMLATAQQTLTEDNHRAALNSASLYKLKDRFPLQVDLEASDIKEICTNRLLGKGTAEAATLEGLFDQFGPQLRLHTKLHDAKFYDAELTKKAFVDLYPFLPAHFDILLRLLGSLAKSTGGIGLRSAIKVIQDILIETHDGKPAVADRPVGWLANSVTLYDSLEKDIRRAAANVHQGVGKVNFRFPDSELHNSAAKTIAVLQILGNLPVTPHNVAALMQTGVSDASRADEIRKVIEEMLKDPYVPLGDKEGNLTFLSEKLRDIEQERGAIPFRSVDIRRITNDALRDSFHPLPSVRLYGTLSVTTGLKVQQGQLSTSLAGDRETIQTRVEFVDAADYDTARTRLQDESRQRTSQSTIFLLGRSNPELENLAVEVFRCQEIARLHRSDLDQEVKDYCTAQAVRALKVVEEQLKPVIGRSLQQGSFIFRGQVEAVQNFDPELLEASKKRLMDVAQQVFSRYGEAAERVETTLAERFLRVGSPAGIDSKLDPLGLVKKVNGSFSVDVSNKAVLSIRDYLNQSGTIEGKRLLEDFSREPFGWSQDTLRYILAAMLMAGELKLKISGREVTQTGQQAIDALKTNKSFGAVGVSLRDGRPSMDVLLKASERLTDLIGESVMPLEQEISKHVVKQFPRFQHEYGPLAERLRALAMGGAERLQNLSEDIQTLLLTDASDAPQRLGGEDSPLFEDLRWAAELKLALDNGLAETAAEIQQYRREIAALPTSGVPGELRRDVEEELQYLRDRLNSESAYEHATDLASRLTTLQSRVTDSVHALAGVLKARLRECAEDLERLPDWGVLTPEQQSSVLARLDAISIEASADLAGLKTLLARDYDVSALAGELKAAVRRQADDARRLAQEEEMERLRMSGLAKIRKSVRVPSAAKSVAELDAVIDTLQSVRSELDGQAEVEVTFSLGE